MSADDDPPKAPEEPTVSYGLDFDDGPIEFADWMPAEIVESPQARGSDLTYLALNYGIGRLPNESDDDLRQRVREYIMEPHWTYPEIAGVRTFRDRSRGRRIPGVGSLRLGDRALSLEDVHASYRELRLDAVALRLRKERTLPAGTLAFEFNKGTWVAGREWKRAAGVPSWNGIGNHRDFRRWVKHSLAPLVPIAHDALTEGRRGVAIQVLCEAVSLEVAIEWTRPTKNSIRSSR